MSIVKSLSRDRPQVEVCNTILTADGFPPSDDRATANILSSHYQKISGLRFLTRLTKIPKGRQNWLYTRVVAQILVIHSSWPTSLCIK
ncbi:hypothetical protein TNIN_458291 [Trichonephila inaurata madagascariensis]|uniref:Uncharacterized protein n=1 Tax=Trichonephila inaurata madagascariensis TaxID=2747483 RepID=A0A8X6Y3T6_9ARAC|nr:hypothetical protein TNIN_458291 [Trichonephila inaurata madagascariensis]